MILSNLHTHTIFSDGAHSVEAMVKSAIEKGFDSIGISDHGHLNMDHLMDIAGLEEYGLIPSTYDAYYTEVARVKSLYKDEIQVYLGVEQEYTTPANRSKVDYVIGAVHSVISPKDQSFIPLDYKDRYFLMALNAFGSTQRLVEEYFSQMIKMIQTADIDILAHLDLIVKLNGDNFYFDTAAPWYHRLVAEVITAVGETNIIVELNTAGFTRSRKVVGYPEPRILDMLYKNEVPIIISSDAHDKDLLDSKFKEGRELLWGTGYRQVKVLYDGKFIDTDIEI